MCGRKTFLWAYWEQGKHKDVTTGDINKSVKFAALQLEYPSARVIPTNEVYTHSLCSAGDALA